MSAIRAELLRDAGAIEHDWWDLWRRDPAATPFQSPAWLLPWRRHFDGGEDVVLSFRDAGGELLGLLPFFAHEGRLLLWGAGTSDWLDGLFDPRLDPCAVTQAIGRLAMPLDLFQLHPGSMLLRIEVPQGWSSHECPAESCAVLALPGAPSTRMTQKLRYYRRRAEHEGISAPQAAGAAEADALVALHTKRWNRSDEPGIFADPRMAAWQKAALPQLQAAGLLRLYAMRSGNATVAALCVLCAKRRAYYYIGGFDPDLAALGLGTILVGHAIGEAEREGHLSFDFLRGREPYKYRWGAVDQPAHARRLTPPPEPAREQDGARQTAAGEPTGRNSGT